MTRRTVTSIPCAAGALDLLADGDRISLAARDRQFGRSCVVTLGTAGALALRAALDARLATPGVVRRVELAAGEARKLVRMAEEGEYGIAAAAESLGDALDSITASLRRPEGRDVSEPSAASAEPEETEETEAGPYSELSMLTGRLEETHAALRCLADAHLHAGDDMPAGALAAALQPVLRDLSDTSEALSRAVEPTRAVPQGTGPIDRPWAPAA